jgi:hypothetical protein
LIGRNRGTQPGLNPPLFNGIRYSQSAAGGLLGILKPVHGNSAAIEEHNYTPFNDGITGRPATFCYQRYSLQPAKLRYLVLALRERRAGIVGTFMLSLEF